MVWNREGICFTLISSEPYKGLPGPPSPRWLCIRARRVRVSAYVWTGNLSRPSDVVSGATCLTPKLRGWLRASSDLPPHGLTGRGSLAPSLSLSLSLSISHARSMRMASQHGATLKSPLAQSLLQIATRFLLHCNRPCVLSNSTTILKLCCLVDHRY